MRRKGEELSFPVSLAAIFAQPDNAAVLRYLNCAQIEDARYFDSGVDGHPADEGGQVFFHKYGRRLPDATRCSICTSNILVHERTSRVFALHQGRFTIALRADFSQLSDCFTAPLLGVTLDGNVDLRALGPEWVLFGADEEEDAAAAFLAAYELAGR